MYRLYVRIPIHLTRTDTQNDYTEPHFFLIGDDEGPDEEEKALVLDVAKGKKAKAKEESATATESSKVHQSQEENSKDSDPDNLLKVAKQIADMEEKIKKISKLPLMEPFKASGEGSKGKDDSPTSSKDVEKIPSVTSNESGGGESTKVLLTTPPPP